MALQVLLILWLATWVVGAAMVLGLALEGKDRSRFIWTLIPGKIRLIPLLGEAVLLAVGWLVFESLTLNVWILSLAFSFGLWLGSHLRVIGLTGGISTGKSTVSALLSESGVTVIDADLIARQIVEPGQPAYKKIVQYFGEEILLENKAINRPLLGERIFTDPHSRHMLNSFTHPYITKEILKQILANRLLRQKRLVVLDAPLLLVVVACKPEQQLQRLMKRNNLTMEQAQDRIKAQIPIEVKVKKAHIVIDNSADIKDLTLAVERAIVLMARKAGCEREVAQIKAKLA